ncbi:helix-turn-helix domain-containing protein [Methylomonas sp. OY6]|uniref:Helix-turn-helix domain-containing protein n=1 Tax=Methylomonas defluvii TaxID=3045149 RepID=A0ABU4UFV6_9GAMM|nr:helix-turn-helix domain-containing protein [Methylomonas sp. OY6]MDX8127993.1 helix-turn-helix domain-containing protein [Methylomonas sp. OY6]
MPNTKKPTVGRPTALKPEFIDQAYNYCLLGATDAQLAGFFGVSEKTINTWKKQAPEFADSLKRGKTLADAQVANSLFHRATGYSHPETKVNIADGQVILTDVTKHHPPDTTAAIFWLKNRQPDKWRDKVEVNGSLKLDKETLDMIETQFVTKMAAAHERQKAVLAEREARPEAE